MIFRYSWWLRRFIAGCGIFSLYFLFSFMSSCSIVTLPVLSQIAVYIMIFSMIYSLARLFNTWMGYQINPFILVGVISYSLIFLLIKNITNIPMIAEICGISASGATMLMNVFLIGNAISNIGLSYCIGKWGLKVVGLTGMVSSFLFLGVFRFLDHPFLMFFVLGCSMSNVMNVVFYYFYSGSHAKNSMFMMSVGFLIPSCLNITMMRDINYGLSLGIFHIKDVIYGIFGLFLIISCVFFIFCVTSPTTIKNNVFDISFLNKKMYWLTILNTFLVCLISAGIKDKIPTIAHLTGNYVNVLQSLDFKGACICLFLFPALLFVFKSLHVLLMCGLCNMITIVMLILVFLSNFYFTWLTKMLPNDHNALFVIRAFLNNIIAPNMIIMSSMMSKSYMIMQFINGQMEKNILSFSIFVGILNCLTIFVSVANVLSYIPLPGMLFVCFVSSLIVILSTMLYKRQVAIV